MLPRIRGYCHRLRHTPPEQATRAAGWSWATPGSIGGSCSAHTGCGQGRSSGRGCARNAPLANPLQAGGPAALRRRRNDEVDKLRHRHRKRPASIPRVSRGPRPSCSGSSGSCAGPVCGGKRAIRSRHPPRQPRGAGAGHNPLTSYGRSVQWRPGLSTADREFSAAILPCHLLAGVQ
jgi:hypothetical protein